MKFNFIVMILAAFFAMLNPLQVSADVYVNFPLDWSEHLMLGDGTQIDLPAPDGSAVSVSVWPQTVSDCYVEDGVKITRHFTEAHLAGPFLVMVYELPEYMLQNDSAYREWQEKLIDQELVNSGFKAFYSNVVYGESALIYSDREDSDFSNDYKWSAERRGVIFAIENFVYRLEVQNCFYLNAYPWYTGDHIYRGHPAYHLNLILDTKKTRIPEEVKCKEPYKLYGELLHKSWHGLSWASSLTGPHHMDHTTTIERDTYKITLTSFIEFCCDEHVLHSLIFTKYHFEEGIPLVFGQLSHYFSEAFAAYPEYGITLFEERYLLGEVGVPDVHSAVAYIQDQCHRGSFDYPDCVPLYVPMEEVEVLEVYEGQHQGYPTIEMRGRMMLTDPELDVCSSFYCTYVLLDNRMYSLIHIFEESHKAEAKQEWEHLLKSFEIH